MIPKQSNKRTSDNLTLDYRKIASIPIGTRNRLASSGLASILSSALTPGQRASLFPRYYQDVSITTQMASLGSNEPFIGRNTGTTQGVPLPSDVREGAKSGVPPDLIPGGLIPGPDGQPYRTPDIKYTKTSGIPEKFGDAGPRAKQAFDFFKSKGWTAEQSAALVGNLMHESGRTFSPTIPGDNGAAVGIGQWHRPRQALFEKFAGHSIQNSTFEEQLNFVQ